MLWTLFIILIVLWLLGVLTSFVLGGLIHILLIVAIIIAIVRVMKGKSLSWERVLEGIIKFIVWVLIILGVIIILAVIKWAFQTLF